MTQQLEKNQESTSSQNQIRQVRIQKMNNLRERGLNPYPYDVQPRQICMYLCRHLTEESLQSIGKSLGKKDHTTVIHGIDKIADEILKDEELNNRIENIKKKINSV